MHLISETRSPSGPYCTSCAHRSCRALRALRLPMVGGHRREFAREHLIAAEIQADNRHLVLWFGEATQSYWVASTEGLRQARTLGELLLLVDPAPVIRAGTSR